VAFMTRYHLLLSFVVNVAACEAAGIEPLIAMGRQPHHQPLAERFADTPPAPENPTPVEAMAHRLKTPEGRKLYALRKQTPEPVFGIIKSVLGFRQFLLRGLDKVRGEWSLVTMAWNIKRMFTLKPRLMRPARVPAAKKKRPQGDIGGRDAIRRPSRFCRRQNRSRPSVSSLSPTGC